MPVSFDGVINSFYNSSFVQGVFTNPFLIAILITLIIILIAVFLFYNSIDSDVNFSYIFTKLGVWVFISTLAVMFIHNKITNKQISGKYEENQDVFKSAVGGMINPNKFDQNYSHTQEAFDFNQGRTLQRGQSQFQDHQVSGPNQSQGIVQGQGHMNMNGGFQGQGTGQVQRQGQMNMNGGFQGQGQMNMNQFQSVGQGQMNVNQFQGAGQGSVPNFRSNNIAQSANGNPLDLNQFKSPKSIEML